MVTTFELVSSFVPDNCIAYPTVVLDKILVENAPNRIYALYNSANGPNDCRPTPLGFFVWEYKDPNEPNTAWKEFTKWHAKISYGGYVYSYIDVNPSIVAWRQWRCRFAGYTAQIEFVPASCTQKIVVKNHQNGSVIPNATVTVTDPRNNPFQVAQTEANGEITFELAKGQAYNVFCQKDGYSQIAQSKQTIIACTPVCMMYLVPEAEPEPEPEPEQSWYRIVTKDDMLNRLSRVKIEKGSALLGITDDEGCLPAGCTQKYPSTPASSVEFRATKTGYRTTTKMVSFPAEEHDMEIHIVLSKLGEGAQGEIKSVTPTKIPAGVYKMETPFKTVVTFKNVGLDKGEFKIKLYLEKKGTLLDIEPMTWKDVDPARTATIEAGVPSWQWPNLYAIAPEDERFRVELWRQDGVVADDVYITPEGDITPPDQEDDTWKYLAGAIAAVGVGYVLYTNLKK